MHDRDTASDCRLHGNAMTPEQVGEAIFRYWDSLRDGGDIPARADIDPRALEDVLDHAFILERQRDNAAAFRVAGRSVNALYGRDARGLDFAGFFAPGDAARIAALLGRVFSRPAWLRLETGLPGAPVSGYLTLLPLLDQQGAPSRALGSYVPGRGAQDRAARRIRGRANIVALTGQDKSHHGGKMMSGTQGSGAAGAGFAEGPVPYLRLVSSKDKLEHDHRDDEE